MNQHNVTQGSPEWIALRAKYFTASEAPAMMGCSPYMTRTELLNRKHTGLVPDVSDFTQKLYDNGHATEAQFRPEAERMVGEELYPVTGSLKVEGLPLLASFDGLTMDDDTGFEHKIWSEENANAIFAHGEPPMHHVWQLEQQLLVADARQILFVTSDGTTNKHAFCWYRSKPERRIALIAGWKQFAQDLATYVPSVVEVAKPVGQAPDTLPALRIELTGMVTVSNLDEFKNVALTAIRGVNRDLTTDQHFADAEKAVKWCADVEERLDAAKAHALSQTASIDALFKTIDDIAAEAKRVRLDLSKLVTTRKDAIKAQAIGDAQKLLAAHVAALNLRIGKPYMPAVNADFAGVIKGKRSLDSINDAIAGELARAKIAANDVADRITVNLRAIDAVNMPLMFADAQTLVQKQPEDLAMVIESRVAKFKADEEVREAAKAAIAVAQAPTTAPQPKITQISSMPPMPPAQPVVDSDALIKLGDINARLAPISISADGLTELGFAMVKLEKGAKLYRDADYPDMVHAIVKRLVSSLQVQPA